MYMRGTKYITNNDDDQRLNCVCLSHSRFSNNVATSHTARCQAMLHTKHNERLMTFFAWQRILFGDSSAINALGCCCCCHCRHRQRWRRRAIIGQMPATCFGVIFRPTEEMEMEWFRCYKFSLRSKFKVHRTIETVYKVHTSHTESRIEMIGNDSICYK